jgi:hypothetical protein
VRKVESAYGEAVQAMTVEHISRPRPHALHDQAAGTLATTSATADPAAVGRAMIKATVAGRDGWTKVLPPSSKASTPAKPRPRSTAPAPWRALARAKLAAREPTLRVQHTTDGLAVVSFKAFSSDVASQIAAELAVRPRGVVLDLRGNGGGWVKEALALIRLFAVDDRPIAKEMSRWRDGSESMDVSRARYPGPLAGVPVVVLVDGNTASAAETTAASLRDTVGARVAGSRTFGKGYAQVVHDLDDGTSIKITNGVVQAPRTTWHGRGLAVDIDKAALARRGWRALAKGRDREMSGAFVKPPRGDAIVAGALGELRTMITP